MTVDDRGRIETVKLKKSIVLNNNKISTVTIEIDHINHGLDHKTGLLNKRKRTNFTVADILKFIMLLNGEDIIAKKQKGKSSQFAVRIECPVRGTYYGKEFVMIFSLNHEERNNLYTITLFPRWKK